MSKDSPSRVRWAHKRKALISDDGYPDCPYCDTPFYYADGELDHLMQKSIGGSNKYKNLVLVCKHCNRLRHNTPLHLFLYSIGVSPEKVYYRLKKMNKVIPDDMLDFLGFDE